MLEVEIVRMDLKKRFSNEKETYKVISKELVKEGMKVYSQVVRGFPDYIVGEFNIPALQAGFMEVKFEERELRPSQVKVARLLKKVAPYYVCRVYADGTLKLFKLS